MQPSSRSNFGILLSLKKETLYPQKITIFLPPSLETTNPISLPVNLPILDTSYKRNQEICGILNLNFFTEHIFSYPQGWSGEEGGMGVQDGGTHMHLWLIHVDVQQKQSQYCKVIIFQLKLID